MPEARPAERRQEKDSQEVSPEEEQIIRDVVQSRKGLHEKLAKQ